MNVYELSTQSGGLKKTINHLAMRILKSTKHGLVSDSFNVSNMESEIDGVKCTIQYTVNSIKFQNQVG